MSEQTQDTSTAKALLKGVLDVLASVLIILVAALAICVLLAIVVGIPVGTTTFVVVSAYKAGGYLYAGTALMVMSIIWEILLG